MNSRSCYLPLVLTVACLAGLRASAVEPRLFDVKIMPAKDSPKSELNELVPIKAMLVVPAELRDAKTALLLSDDGPLGIGQLTRPSLLSSAKGDLAREMHFVIPRRWTLKPLTWTAKIPADDPTPPGFDWKVVEGKHAELFQSGKPVLRYVCPTYDPQRREETYKVFHHVYDPRGRRFVTKGAGGKFTHHRGLFYGFNRITYQQDKHADIWHCKGNTHQAHAKFLSSEAGPMLARHRLGIDWYGPNNDVFAKEQRELTVYHLPGGRLIEFASRLRSVAGDIQLDGDPQHAGFQFRAAQEVAAKTNKQTYYLRPDGKGKPGETRNWSAKNPEHANLPWNAMSFVLDNKRFTCCYLDHPKNPKEARYSERDYGRFGSYFAYKVTEAKPLDINYRIWLQEREMTVEEVNALHLGFVAPPFATAVVRK